jgi:hypothetical protein
LPKDGVFIIEEGVGERDVNGEVPRTCEEAEGWDELFDIE